MDDTDKIIIYVDGARDDQIAGLGYSISGAIEYDGRKYLTGHYTSMEAEFHALIEAVRIASKRSDSREYCEVYTDAKGIVKKICGSQAESDEWETYRSSARWLLNKFDSWEVNYTDRSCNETAHELAREALFDGRRSEQ